MERRELWAIDVAVLRDARRVRGWSRNALALEAGLSHHTVAKAERGEGLFPESVKLLAQALDVPIDVLHKASAYEPVVSQLERRLMEMVENHLESYLVASIENNRPVLWKEFCKPLDRQIVLTASSVKFSDAPFLGRFHGVDGVVNYIEACMDFVDRKKRWNVESIRCLDSRRVMIIAGEDVAVPSFGKIVRAESVVVWTFDGKPGQQRITSLHQHIDRMEFIADL